MAPTLNVYQPRILVIEDEPDVLDALVDYLKIEGMDAYGVSSLREAETWMNINEFDIILLDLGLHDGDGINWLKSRLDLREKGVIIITSRSDANSRISGIRAGADVYLVKPALPEEICSLVNNLMRRLHRPISKIWMLDELGWRLTAPDGREVKITHSEHVLLHQLAHSSRQVVSRKDLAISLGHDSAKYDYRRMEIMIRRLRNKVNDTLGISLPIETAHRFGYAFTEPLKIKKIDS